MYNVLTKSVISSGSDKGSDWYLQWKKQRFIALKKWFVDVFTEAVIRGYIGESSDT